MSRCVMVALILLIGMGCATQKEMGNSVQERYTLHSMALDDGTWTLIRFKPETGETWRAREQRWVMIEELEPIPPSAYGLELIAMGGVGWNMARIDRSSGRVWYAKGSQWVEMLEQQ
jgi:hypothetical protein